MTARSPPSAAASFVTHTSQYRCSAPPLTFRVVDPDADGSAAKRWYADAGPEAESPARSSTAIGPPTTSSVTVLTDRDAPRSRSRPTPSLRLPKFASAYVCVRQAVPSRRKPLPPEGSKLVIVDGSFTAA